MNETKFRNLVSNIYMPDYNYIGYKISFRTVFYKTAYTYCCCACSFEHEYMDYLSDKGNINEAMYERVVNNVLNGECEHVKNVPGYYIKETFLYGIHIAAAIGTIQALEKHLCQTSHVLGGVYRLSPAANAALKSNCSAFRVFGSHTGALLFEQELSRSYLYARKTEQNVCEITLKTVTHLELAVMKQNFSLVEIILQLGLKFVPAGIVSALKIAFSNSELPIKQLLVDYIGGLANRGKTLHALLCAETAVVFNEPTFLKQIIKSIKIIQPNGNTLNYWLKEACAILQRKECCDIIAKYETPSATPRSVRQRAEKLFYILENFYETCHEEVVEAFLTDPESLEAFRQTDNFKGSRAHTYINSDKKQTDARILKTMFDLGLDINSVDTNGSTSLIRLLTHYRRFLANYKHNRELLETLIYENPDIDLNDPAIKLAVDIDAKWDSRCTSIEKDMVGDYFMDSRDHAIAECTNNYAFNYICPLLIDCGFRVKQDLMNRAMELQNLPSEVLTYFQQYLDEPRPLMLRCRDTLRKNLSGRNLHRYLEYQELPQKIKNFILIKPLWY